MKSIVSKTQMIFYLFYGYNIEKKDSVLYCEKLSREFYEKNKSIIEKEYDTYEKYFAEAYDELFDGRAIINYIEYDVHNILSDYYNNITDPSLPASEKFDYNGSCFIGEVIGYYYTTPNEKLNISNELTEYNLYKGIDINNIIKFKPKLDLIKKDKEPQLFVIPDYSNYN